MNEEIIVVVKLINGEVIVGSDVISNGSGERMVVKDPVRYEVHNNQVLLIPYFGLPKEIRFDIERVLYDYPIDNADLIGKYKSMIEKSLIKTVNNKIILAS